MPTLNRRLKFIFATALVAGLALIAVTVSNRLSGEGQGELAQTATREARLLRSIHTLMKKVQLGDMEQVSASLGVSFTKVNYGWVFVGENVSQHSGVYQTVPGTNLHISDSHLLMFSPSGICIRRSDLHTEFGEAIEQLGNSDPGPVSNTGLVENQIGGRLSTLAYGNFYNNQGKIILSVGPSGCISNISASES